MQDVTIYSTPTCHFCHAAKEFFNENNVQFTEIDLGANPDRIGEMVEKSGQRGVPVILVGDEVIVGFDENSLRGKLGL